MSLKTTLFGQQYSTTCKDRSTQAATRMGGIARTTQKPPPSSEVYIHAGPSLRSLSRPCCPPAHRRGRRRASARCACCDRYRTCLRDMSGGWQGRCRLFCALRGVSLVFPNVCCHCQCSSSVAASLCYGCFCATPDASSAALCCSTRCKQSSHGALVRGSGSRADREITNIQDYFLGLT